MAKHIVICRCCKQKFDAQIEDKDFIKVTISVGVSEFNKDITGEELFRRADKALYDAKTHGRNKVVIFENEQ